jgi:hypothetical protein
MEHIDFKYFSIAVTASSLKNVVRFLMTTGATNVHIFYLSGYLFMIIKLYPCFFSDFEIVSTILSCNYIISPFIEIV